MSLAFSEETSPSHGIRLQHSIATLKYETLKNSLIILFSVHLQQRPRLGGLRGGSRGLWRTPAPASAPPVPAPPLALSPSTVRSLALAPLLQPPMLLVPPSRTPHRLTPTRVPRDHGKNLPAKLWEQPVPGWCSGTGFLSRRVSVSRWAFASVQGAAKREVLATGGSPWQEGAVSGGGWQGRWHILLLPSPVHRLGRSSPAAPESFSAPPCQPRRVQHLQGCQAHREPGKLGLSLARSSEQSHGHIGRM